jgi:lipopolysaccharide/colanic/teichoic acid biosynthesis glycosyltransferase
MFRRVIAFLLLCLAVVPFLVFAGGIQLYSPGPLFFRQRRVGLNGRVFMMWKLRTMVPRAEEVLQRLVARDHAVAREWAAFGRLEKDPRIAGPFGRWARKFSVDELPQLLNVLTGDMGFVGPRPILPQQTAELPQAMLHVRQSVLPGLTGLWQVKGRSETTLEDMMHWDCIYVARQSLGFKLYILALTVPAVLRARGAY